MSEQTSKVFVKPHNQAFAKGDVLKLGYNGKSGYWRVIGFEDDKPYAKLVFLGYNKDDYPNFMPPLPLVPYGQGSFETGFNYVSPADGRSYEAKVAYYNYELTETQSPNNADKSCENFINYFVQDSYDPTLYYATNYMTMPTQKVYYVPALAPNQTVLDPNIVVNRNISGYAYYINQVGVTDQSWAHGRRCRCLSMDDIVEYFDSTELTARDIADNLLGGKHGLDSTHWKTITEGFLYDGSAPCYDNTWGNGSYINYYHTSKENEYYGSYINWDPNNPSSASTQNWLIPVIELNLNTYRLWEKATDW